ncbi:MAG: hypothetical protein GY853_04850 [PVC group bacterium]|nr:hypothetical protein [PVC group bacterium]
MKNILVINPFGIGDVLFTTPVLRALKKEYPKSFVGYLCNRQVAALLQDNPDVDELLFFSRGDFKKAKKESFIKGVSFLFRAFCRLRSLKFDIVVDLSLVSQYSVLMWFLGVKERWGFDYRNRGRFLTHKVKINGFQDKHVTEYYRDLLLRMNIKDFESNLKVNVNRREEEWADEFLKLKGVHPDVLLIGISPFGGKSWGPDAASKQWPQERFARVAKQLIEKHKAVVVFLGVKDEKKSIENICRIIDSQSVINAAGETDLTQLSALISCLDVFIGNDSGTLHIAAALGVKTVALFGAVDERVYGPVTSKKNQVVVSSQSQCRPCYKDFKKPVCRTMECLLNITEKNVLDAVEKIL